MSIINAPKAAEPVGAYPHARRANGFLFLSGIGPRRPGAKEIPGVSPHDIKVQTESVIENLKIILEAAGASLKDIIDVQVFLTDMKRDFKDYNEVYAKYFTEIQATRTTIQVVALPTPIAVEFKVIALDTSKS